MRNDGEAVVILDQTALPHAEVVRELFVVADAAEAIAAMRVRGAPLIGVTAAYGLWLALREDPRDASLERAHALLLATRPTAVNLRWALDRVRIAVATHPPEERAAVARALADALAEEDVLTNHALGRAGLALFREALEEKRRRGSSAPLQVLTHCNAGWLATVGWGTATAPIYLAQEEGLPIHVWVDETRPRNQGASLTAWELARAGVPCTVIVDNAGGHLMQHGHVDLCIVGTDRTTARGDVCNKIGTYLKALAAWDNGVPFYVAAPSSSIDFSIEDGLMGIPIEERSPEEVTRVQGRLPDGGVSVVDVTPAGVAAKNYAFDVTPARLVTALVTERGVVAADAKALAALFADRLPGRGGRS